MSNSKSGAFDLRSWVDGRSKAVDAALDRFLPKASAKPATIHKAMRYSIFAGGKRMRPALVLAAAEACGGTDAAAMPLACAVECIHTYSLIHDDLPAMDDDDLRRGRPTVHKAYDEATAILAGDGLLTMAFEVLADPATHPDGAVRAALVAELARASGAAGMVGGQMIDLMAADLDLTDDGLKRLQNMKTGCIIAVACRMGAILGGAAPGIVDKLGAYGMDMGLAFQIADDVLDVESTAAETGKATGKDAAAGKATFVDRLGLDGAKRFAHALVDQAYNALESFGHKASLLRAAAMFAITRRN